MDSVIRRETDSDGHTFRSLSRRSLLGLAGASGAAIAASQSASGAPAVTTTAGVGMAPVMGGTVAAENALSGSPVSEWESWGDDDAIAGFTTEYSVLPGETVTFKVKTTSADYRIRIYRLGWYQGDGARRLADITPSATLPQSQPEPLTEVSTGLIDCGNWEESGFWTVPVDALSGVYYALFERLDGGRSNHTVFVVRRSGPSDILLQTSEMTSHAYNRFGGNSLYFGDPVGRAYKVSYNRPFNDGETESNFFNAEVALLRWLERNGYDVSYCGGIDVHRDAEVFQGRKIFVSSGHDEYVTGPQRANVEAARDAGIHLIFMTGNEYFWRVRMEDSLDAAATPLRTMVCYKETLADAKIDPSPEWTGTWRDPRFSPPSNGGRPENELTGQLFRAILPVSAPDKRIVLSGEFAGCRLWRNTPVASLEPGDTRNLAPNTLGYEFDVDADNGFRPAGLIRLSSTEAEAPLILQDYGATYIPGTVTHHLTMYRASSGALVFATGTVQWSYGLDDYHLADEGTPTDPVIQQATLNVLADMGAQPQTRQTGLVAASASSDTLAPTTTITSPTDGAQAPIGSPVTVAGSAVDSGGGIVAAVEVSIDEGQTWHPATGRDSWSYVFTPTNTGDLQVQVRAIDDSCNIGSAANVTVAGAPRSYPCPIWAEGTTPQTEATDETTPIEVGVRFQADIDGFVTGLRFYKGVGNNGTHVGTLWSDTGSQRAQATFVGESPTGWQTVPVPAVPVAAGTTYVASVFMPAGHYPADAGYFTSAYELAPLRALANGESGGANGVYRYGSAGFPTDSFGSTNYWVDVLFDTDNHQAPSVVSQTPAPGLQSVALDTVVVASFSESVSDVTMTLTDPEGIEVGGSVAYDESEREATFVAGSTLQPLTQYTAQVVTAVDVSGNNIVPFDWVFTTTGAPGTSPTSMWDTSAEPSSFDDSQSALEVGLKFSTVATGSITALRFYKAPSSSGLHVGHLWDHAGLLLATGTFENETSSGWQQVNLDSPVELTPNNTYVVSYYAPKGGYGSTGGYFDGSGVERGPLRAPRGQLVGGNGVYAYGSGGFPTSSWNNANYWVDVVFQLAPDVGPPDVTNRVPAPELIEVPRDTVIAAEFSEPVDPPSIVFTLTDDGGNDVPGGTTYDAQTATATFTPQSQLASNAVYTASVIATDTAGNAAQEATTWSFTTINGGSSPVTLWHSGALPAIEAVNETSAVELGVRVKSSLAGRVTGLRFFKGEGNEGPHLGRLWTATGTLLGSLSFANETKRGWQQAYFPDAISISANTAYVASYHTPSGRYAVTAGGLSNARTRGSLTAPASTSQAGNGLFAYGSGGFPENSWNGGNYWVDVIFEDSSGPGVQDRSPQPGSTADPSTEVRVTFDEDVVESTIALSLRDGGGGVVAGSVSYNEESRTATFVPTAALAAGATFTATVESAEDLQGNAMDEAVTWGFSTLGADFATIWPANTTPATILSNDSGSLEIGVKFQTSVAGAIHGVRFYKGGPANSGPHVGNLWAGDGTSLATAQFGGETARGWQTVVFSTPVAVTVDQTYVASYYAPEGNYSVDGGYFNGTSTVRGDLEALQNGDDGGNGVYVYGSATAFPSRSYNGGNYWVDVLFVAD